MVTENQQWYIRYFNNVFFVVQVCCKVFMCNKLLYLKYYKYIISSNVNLFA